MHKRFRSDIFFLLLLAAIGFASTEDVCFARKKKEILPEPKALVDRTQIPTKENPWSYFDYQKIVDEKKSEKWQEMISYCREAGSLQTMRITNNLLDEKCRPEVLYSWGDVAKVLALIKVMGERTWVNVFRPLYAARSSISTFGYGPIPIRIKLKAGILFVRTDKILAPTIENPLGGCKDLNQDLISKALFFRSDKNFSDWTICSPDVIHSWSYGTQENFDEMMLEYDRLMTFGLQGIDYYSAGQFEAGSIFKEWVDGKYFTFSFFSLYLSKYVERVGRGQIGLFFNPALDDSEKTQAQHFNSRADFR